MIDSRPRPVKHYILPLALLAIEAVAAESVTLLPPRGISPLLMLQPDGKPTIGKENADIRVRAVLAGRFMPNVTVRVFADRLRQSVAWEGKSNSQGQVAMRLPVSSVNRRLAVDVSHPDGREPRFVQLIWSTDPPDVKLIWDSTACVDTTSLNKWQLRSGATSVFFNWSERPAADELLQVLVAQRWKVEELIGGPAEPMGAVLLPTSGERSPFISMNGNHRMRSGRLLHGIRGWPLLGNSVSDLESRFEEDRELHVTLAHELAENTLLYADSIGIAHSGTRWMRDGVAETSAAFSAWETRPATVAAHFRTRLDNLNSALQNDDTEHVDLLAWTQENPSPLVQYACAAAWFLHEERHRPGTIAAVCKKALAVDQASSADLVRWLSEVTGRDCEPELRKAKLKAAIGWLEAVIADATACAPWESRKKPAG